MVVALKNVTPFLKVCYCKGSVWKWRWLMGSFFIHNAMLVAPVLSYAGRHYWNEFTTQGLHHVQVKSLHWIFYLPFLSSYILADPYLMMSLNLGGILLLDPSYQTYCWSGMDGPSPCSSATSNPNLCHCLQIVYLSLCDSSLGKWN